VLSSFSLLLLTKDELYASAALDTTEPNTYEYMVKNDSVLSEIDNDERGT
tara:strand:+ start:162 stop:311 length:150 start_codon:yes stop_codon:yes gene_type:complete